MDVDLEELAALVRLLKETDFSEFRYEKGEVRIVVRRGDVTDTYPSEPDPRRAAPQLQPTPAGRSTAGRAGRCSGRLSGARRRTSDATGG